VQIVCEHFLILSSNTLYAPEDPLYKEAYSKAHKVNTNGQSNMESISQVETEIGPMNCFDNDAITKQLIKFGNHTRPEFAFATCLIDSETSLFDIGAHIGTFSLTALRKMGEQSKLLCVEGSQETFRVLNKNLKTRDAERVVAINRFVGSFGKSYELITNTENTGASYARERHSGLNTAIGLDELCKEYFEPSFIKIDVEGAEERVLTDFQRLGDLKPILYLEISPHLDRFGSSKKSIDVLLRWYGYRLFVNIGERNARHDLFKVHEIRSISRYRRFFDVLCVPASSYKARALSDVTDGKKSNMLMGRALGSLKRHLFINN